jgi:branched-chain amino acid aminotransferase
MERLHRSARILMMKLPYSTEELCQITIELLRREAFREDVYIRPLLYKSDPAIAVQLHGLTDSFTMFAVGFGQYLAGSAIKACISSWRRIDDNIIPSRAKACGAYLNSALAKSEALLNGYDEAIVLSNDGHVAEASAANLFIVRNGVLITPPTSGDILEGITRQVVMELARNQLGIPVREAPIDRTELYVAEEAFFCGTGAEIKPIVEIDRRPIGDGTVGPIGRMLVNLYADVVRGRVKKYQHWCTPVYELA